MPTPKTRSTPRSRRNAFPGSSRLAALAVLAAFGGCGGGDDSGGGDALCAIPCVATFFTDAKVCADVTAGVECAGFDCYANGARTFAAAGELRDPGDSLCLKRWTTATGQAWQTGDQQLRYDTDAASVLCPDGSSHATVDPATDDPTDCDPIDEPFTCGVSSCGGDPVCPAEGCLCRESACAREFFADVRACAGLDGNETCTYDKAAGKACYSNGAFVTGDANLRTLFSPDGKTECLVVTVGPVTAPARGYQGQRDTAMLVDESGSVVTCPNQTTEPGCGSGALENFSDSCDPSYILDPLGCCTPGTCP